MAALIEDAILTFLTLSPPSADVSEQSDQEGNVPFQTSSQIHQVALKKPSSLSLNFRTGLILVLAYLTGQLSG